MTSILVVDDHPFLRAGLRSVLAESEFGVVAEACNGDQAMTEIADHDPDIVLLDVSIPPPDGIAVLEQLRSAGDDRRVVLLTASISDSQLLRAIRSGSNGIVMKDGAEDVLLDSLREVAAGRTAVSRDLLERTVAVCLDEPAAANSFARLGVKERAIAAYVSEGMRNRDIAEATGLSEGTVKVYLHRIYSKLRVNNRTELAIYIRRQGATG